MYSHFHFPKMVAMLLVAICLHCTALLAQAPALMNYQGRLLAAEGQFDPTVPTVSMQFSIYSTSEGGEAIWGPQIYDTVHILNGEFNVVLGPVDSSGAALANIFTRTHTGERYLSIRINDEEELLPRQQFLSAPYALSVPASGVTGQIERDQISNTAVSTAQIANGAVTRAKLASTERVPVGTVVAYFGTSAPAGWLLCNGAAIPSGSAYNELRNLVGNNTPDLRGMFLRGTGRNSNSSYRYSGDSSRAVGSFQMDELREHSHRGFGAGAGGPLSARPAIVAGDNQFRITVITNSPAYEISSAFNSHGGEETRPKNAAVTWIIKY